ncbi:MAG: IS21-like element helper ATPase IstB [Candidatus Riflebacteria bacterium]
MKPTQTLTSIKNFLQILKLKKILEKLDEEMAWAIQNNPTPSEFLEKILAVEASALIDRRVERRIREARLPERKLLVDFDFKFQTGVEKSQIMELAKLDFVERKQGLILAGSSGTGKSHIAKALLLQACAKSYRCRYTTGGDMLNDLMAGLADNSLQRRLKQYISPEILLIDEVGLDKLEQKEARHAGLFHKVIDGRYCKGSTLVTTNIDFKELGDYLGDPVTTTAIIDRMIHHSILITIQGPSWRMHESRKLNKKVKDVKTES